MDAINSSYTYVLKSRKDGKFYIGYSADLKSRFSQHRRGEVESTKNRRPMDLVFYEAFRDKRDAERRERYLKTEKGKLSLRQIVRYFSGLYLVADKTNNKCRRDYKARGAE